MPNSRCIVNDFGGEPHPYRYCVKPLKQMVNKEEVKRKSNAFNMEGIKQYTGAVVKYGTSLVSDPRDAIADECYGKLGNKYVLKSNMKCKNMAENVHTFINNMPEYNYLTQRKDENIGLIPATVGSALQINGGSLIRALYEDPQKNCIKVNLPCHLIDKNNSANNIRGTVNNVPITVKQYDKLVSNGTIIPSDDEKQRRRQIAGFTNLYQSIQNYLHENPELLPNNNEDLDNLYNNNDDFVSNLYYLFLSIFLLFLVFKFIHKK